MYYINHAPNDGGNFGSPQSEAFPGALALPEELLADYIAAKGFAEITADGDGTVTAVAANQAALAAYEAAQSALPAQPPEPGDTELLLQLAADHEERICLLELGVN